MYYSDFDKIETDGFVGTKFGKENQLEVIGWSGKSNTSKLYIVKCSVCEKDPELFGDGLFRSIKSSLSVGQIPCGCSISARRDERYYSIICQRKATELGYTFHGWSEKFTDRKTKISLECTDHGIWNTGIINNFINRSVGCPRCKAESVGKRFLKSDDDSIKDFFQKGGFPEGTVFERSELKDKRGHKIFWMVHCPICNETGKSTASSLLKGSRSCGCGKSRQKQAYINIVKDGELILGLKFGIANDSSKRIKDHIKNSVFDIEPLFVFEFENKELCKEAEAHCLTSLNCGIFSKEEFKDGWTETTSVSNLDFICDIYRNYGGIKVEDVTCH